ncbi:agmatine deiminase family protein [Mycobacterium sp. CBMA271]|uniref:agmatine deiminase family protein n=1 Tax=unclassified Mycobacteroides TaxID=2618759 RepID=UPI0012DED636|nr:MULTISPECIES: agmatine deiminase family protein [unclassified Mycobacteroides]MUM16936.1 agmatine deiminase [Mycobacteroides sp. CBMA 326]MUM24074.1 agmatine deiminase family protein [Mycobacteroides sp. CBMA 271]
MRRRHLFQLGAGVAAGLALTSCADERDDNNGEVSDGRTWRMPDEGEPHLRTWMAFGASEEIWGQRLNRRVQQNLAAIAQAIAQFEPVSMLVRPQETELARKLAGPDVDLIPAPLDDLWIRDSGPVFVRNDSGSAAVDFNFNGWGNKQKHDSDAKVADEVAKLAGVPALHTNLVLEGGGIEVDGEGTALITESCVLNNNRNRGRSKKDVEAELQRLLGLQKIIWLPGIAGMDITDGHTDFYARFAGPGVVVAGLDNDPDSFDYDVTRQHLKILETATDAAGRALQVEVLEAPEQGRDEFESEDFAAGYINFYVCNGGVIAPEFGDPRADAEAKSTLERVFPGRRVIQLDIDGIAAGGGGIHCATQQEPR